MHKFVQFVDKRALACYAGDCIRKFITDGGAADWKQ